MDIKIGVVGEILAGDDVGSFVKVVDDATNTGGYLILTSNNGDMGAAFDDWVDGPASLHRYFIEAGWSIRWLDSGSNQRS